MKISTFFTYLFIFLLIFDLISAFCPPGTSEIPGQNICIDVHTEKDTYDQAANVCLRKGGDLVRIENAFINSFLVAIEQNALDGNSALIGLHRGTNGIWTYSDGSPLVYQNWASGEPSAGKDCALLDPSTSKWKTDFDPLDPNEQPPFVTRNFTTAERLCREMGAHLASIHSDAENTFLHELVSAEHSIWCTPAEAWIGLQFNATTKDWAWTDGSPVDFNNNTYVYGMDTFYGILNDPGCEIPWWWPWNNYDKIARYVCKKDAAI
ncbi:unnamed protein product, partial [Mesorhabditis belari]|uniref:C-type lectin domain-containing protein n=1 Tax=Mesorhabditis belari TaxID=2138241 RepID=A0AAF3EBK6_9BILA